MIQAFKAFAFTAVLATGVAVRPVQAQTFTVLYTFTGAPDGSQPQAGLLRDAAGNLYGTTFYGGTSSNCTGLESGCGTVFKVDPSGKETVLHSFSGADGQWPEANLIRDNAGNLYGTTTYGGTNGLGAVFKLDPTGNETVLYGFGGRLSGGVPFSGLNLDEEGNLFGTSAFGGPYTMGTVFRINAAGNASILHSFGRVADGRLPSYGGLLLDKTGVLYGTTLLGGPNIQGTVFKLDQAGTETILHSFGAVGDGVNPYSGVTRDPAGNFYGTTYLGGAFGYGTVFKLDPSGTETLLYNFANTDGAYPSHGGDPGSGRQHLWDYVSRRCSGRWSCV